MIARSTGEPSPVRKNRGNSAGLDRARGNASRQLRPRNPEPKYFSYERAQRFRVAGIDRPRSGSRNVIEIILIVESRARRFLFLLRVNYLQLIVNISRQPLLMRVKYMALLRHE